MLKDLVDAYLISDLRDFVSVVFSKQEPLVLVGRLPASLGEFFKFFYLIGQTIKKR
jgi:hypothetical protein